MNFVLTSAAAARRLQVTTKLLQVNGRNVAPSDLHNVICSCPWKCLISSIVSPLKLIGLASCHCSQHCCYSAQDPALISELTVLETVQFNALLGLSEEIDDDDKLELCEEVLAQLQLTHCSNTLIGNAFTKGVSGGERKVRIEPGS